MTTATIELETTEFIDKPVIPKKIGFCTNPVSLIFIDGKFVGVPCSRPIDDQDIEAVGLVCASCVKELLTLSTKDFGFTDPEKSAAGTKKKLAGLVTTRNLENARKPPNSGKPILPGSRGSE